jgi:acetoin:2,6-dichlorophenolindophenol oxidoreductase subunit beta
MPKISYLQALRDAMAEEMRRDSRVFVMGEDVCQNLYGSSAGLADEFGEDRILDVPLSEAGFVGAAAGAAMVGMRPIVDVTIASFLYPAADQIISIIAKSRYLYGGQTHVPLVIRCCMMYNSNSAAQHSDRPYSMFMGIPGLKIITPADAADAKGLLKAAVRDDDPVLCFEDRNCWASSAEVPDGDHIVPLGKAAIKRAGRDATVFAVAGGVPLALQAAAKLAKEGIEIEVIDPRTVKPLDTQAVLESVARTGRFIAVDPSHRTGSLASEISAVVAEQAFDHLKAPIRRVTTPDIHIPFARSMERGLFPTADRIAETVREIMRR